MNIIICGASGLVGCALTQALKSKHNLTLVGRDASRLDHNFTCLSWDELSTDLLADYDCVINLAGENIGNKKWSAAQKQLILDSRVNTATQIANLCAQLKNNSPRIFNASAIGIYGIEDKMVFDENTQLDHTQIDFLSQVATQWEAALDNAINIGVNVVKLRFAVILSAKDGALAKMLPSFKFGMGAIISSGKQPFSWVSIDDVVSAIKFLLEKPEASGAFNIVADEVVTQQQFAKTLAATLHRPCFMHLPDFMIKLMFGEMGETLLLNGVRVKATRLKQLGFQFKHPRLKQALARILKT